MVFTLGATPYKPLKCRCHDKKSNHIRVDYLNLNCQLWIMKIIMMNFKFGINTQNSFKGHVLRLAEFWQSFGETSMLHNLLNGDNMSITLIRFSYPYSCIKCQHHEEHTQNEEYILRRVALLWTLPTSHTNFLSLEHVMIVFIMVNNVKHKEVYHLRT